ncbi:hypothetical protein BT69DRAFT_1297263 [Atractiella rhizophila]|nr:hypothetical protein BT69DRAFT_1297263 [Atractiella rhizophila]
MKLGLQVRMVYHYALDVASEGEFCRSKPVRNDFQNQSQWENAMEKWEAGNARAVAILLANLYVMAANQLSEQDCRVASAIVAKMRTLFSTTQAVMGHTIFARLVNFHQGGSGSGSMAQFITDWNAIYTELVSADASYALSNAVKFLIFVNLLEQEWRKFALNPKNVTRNDITDLFEKLKAEDMTNTVIENGDTGMNPRYQREMSVYAVSTSYSRSVPLPPSSQPPMGSYTPMPQWSPSPSRTFQTADSLPRYRSTNPYRTASSNSPAPHATTPHFQSSSLKTTQRQYQHWSVHPPTLQQLGKEYRCTRRVYGRPGTRVFGRRAWDYDGLELWPGSIAPSGHFVVFGRRAWDYDGLELWPGSIAPSGHFVVHPKQCVYCLGMGHISSGCHVPAGQRDTARDAAFASMGITLCPSPPGRPNYVHPSVLIASPVFSTSDELNDTALAWTVDTMAIWMAM